MTIKQRVIKLLYPLIERLGRTRAKYLWNKAGIVPPTPFHSLSAKSINGDIIDFSQFRGKKVLVVNTASDCGFTPQYEPLQELYKKFQHKLTVVGFPANDFQEQEKGDNESIEAFCKLNYGVTFPLASKSIVVKDPRQHSVFNWLTNAQYNGWNDRAPAWNFSKYLIDEDGKLAAYFDPAISPLDETVQKAIDK